MIAHDQPDVIAHIMAPESLPGPRPGGSYAGSMTEIDTLAEQLRTFAAERDWEQFHTPKNLAMALAGEAGELLAEFQWLTPAESIVIMDDREAGQRVRTEIADVLLYVIRLADVLGVDLIRTAHEKLDANARRYDVDSYRGTARKAPPLG
jgi:NTP pyrophosphatase (non-canonical NTP hydrolase)